MLLLCIVRIAMPLAKHIKTMVGSSLPLVVCRRAHILFCFIYVLAYIGLGLSLMVFNFQQYFSHIVALSCINGRNRRIRRKPHTCRVTNKRYHIMLYTSAWLRFELTPSVVIGTDCIISFKSNYHTITDTTAAYIGVKHIFVIWVTCWVSYKRKGLLSLPEHCMWLGLYCSSL
jgi:hypothetical protein